MHDPRYPSRSSANRIEREPNPVNSGTNPLFSRWRCVRCDAREVEKLPANFISPHPGYRCRACGYKMRSKGMLFVYLVTLVLGLVLFVLGIYTSLDERFHLGHLGFLLFRAIPGFIVAMYSVFQILRPTPRRARPEEMSAES